MDRIVDYITPAAFEDELKKIIASGFNKDKAIELMLDVLESNGYSAGVQAYRDAEKTCNKDYCEV